MNKIRITSLILTITFLSLFIPANLAMSQDATEKTPPEKECEEKKPKFLEEAGIDDFKYLVDLEAQIDKGGVVFDYNKFQEILDENKTEYHKYVECIFNYAEKEILGNVGLSNGTIQANTPNSPDVIDWMDPPAACLSYDKLNVIVNNTAPNQLLTPLLTIQGNYSDYLDALVALYKFRGQGIGLEDKELSLTAIEEFSQKAALYTNMDLQIDMEKEMSIVAMNMAFTELKELRTSFVMHVQFQCMLNNLEKYRKWLGDIRTMVEAFPGRLEDASMSK
jgi:hypothetical protein